MLPQPFQFTQSSLQDYVDCGRRFQLRYINALAWPAVRAEPLLEHERHIERGIRFHRLIERHQLGMDPTVLEASIRADDTLRGWWQSYLHYDALHKLDAQRRPELSLSTTLNGVRLAAKFDLLAIVPQQQAIIFDWKTYARAPRREWFVQRLQTRIYPIVLLRAGGALFGGEIRPEQIQMTYWITGAPNQSVTFDYSADQAARDEEYLSGLIADILRAPEDAVWPLTADEAHCRFCEYRSLCERGVGAGHIGDDMLLPDEEMPSLVRLADVEEVGF
ncbi:MAG TPA: PD-(D/E)XK nuclease family protein [Aggregatilinea sp.]|uniref:PD-(D/E)XK nuclease family protein n=1 Tax=Aggregatilinea sp. TaxID=2806333 RepID=UPI002CCDE1E1|nr:PD-(D/E)XK nuclease family protein [Aggregatilinea sp.]HML20160.1 PD-(D/E)XK nuclease family protein [Aggregatilinea sp.]